MQTPPSNTPRDKRSLALRAGDSDRERVASALQHHYTDGRLTYEELQDRLQTTYAAKTFGELDIVLHDLPEKRPSASAARPVAPRGGGGGGGGGGITRNSGATLQPIATYLVLCAFLIAIWVVSGRHGSFWPIWPILVFGLITANRVIRRLGH